MGRVSDTRTDPAFRICFVCTGNICRSPMAEAVFRRLIAEHGFETRLKVESAATGDWHVGERADARTIGALDARGYDGSRHRARQFDPGSFPSLDMVVAFDRGQERILREWAGDEHEAAKVHLLLSFDPDVAGPDVPDPYYSDDVMFETVLGMIERACLGLFRQLQPVLRQGVT